MAGPTAPAPPPSPDSSSAGWALLWLGGLAAAAWLPLLLADSLPRERATGRLAGLEAAAPAVTNLNPSTIVPSGPFQAFPSPSQEQAQSAGPAPMAPVAPAPAPPARDATPSAPADPPTPADPAALSGSLLLGGPLSLASLNERAMVPAARLEQTLRSRSADRLQAVPLHWRSTMQALLQGQDRVLPAEVVRLPAPHLQKPEEYPMALQADGMAETPVTPAPRSRQTLERWAQRQAPDPQGNVRPVVVVLEPLAAEPEAATP